MNRFTPSDESENSASDPVKVTIVDATNPEISNPSDLEHNESSVENETRRILMFYRR